MKTVFSSHADVSHAYAQQNQDEGSASNLFFEGPAMYSYGRHFLLSLIVTNDKGERAILLNQYSYSSSTNSHQSILSGATRHRNQIFVPYLSPDSASAIKYRGGTFADKMRETTEEIVRHSLADLKEIENKLAKARKPEIYIHQAQRINHRISEYFLFIGCEPPAELQEALKICVPSPELIQKIKDRQKEEARREEARQKEQIEKWLSYEIDYPGRLKYDLLRKATTGPLGTVIETSQGVKMTIQEAKAIYLQLASQQLKPGDKVLGAGYTVISVNGVVKIGCHTFETDYLLTFGKTL